MADLASICPKLAAAPAAPAPVASPPPVSADGEASSASLLSMSMPTSGVTVTAAPHDAIRSVPPRRLSANSPAELLQPFAFSDTTAVASQSTGLTAAPAATSSPAVTANWISRCRDVQHIKNTFFHFAPASNPQVAAGELVKRRSPLVAPSSTVAVQKIFTSPPPQPPPLTAALSHSSSAGFSVARAASDIPTTVPFASLSRGLSKFPSPILESLSIPLDADIFDHAGHGGDTRVMDASAFDDRSTFRSPDDSIIVTPPSVTTKPRKALSSAGGGASGTESSVQSALRLPGLPHRSHQQLSPASALRLPRSPRSPSSQRVQTAAVAACRSPARRKTISAKVASNDDGFYGKSASAAIAAATAATRISNFDDYCAAFGDDASPSSRFSAAASGSHHHINSSSHLQMLSAAAGGGGSRGTGTFIAASEFTDEDNLSDGAATSSASPTPFSKAEFYCLTRTRTIHLLPTTEELFEERRALAQLDAMLFRPSVPPMGTPNGATSRRDEMLLKLSQCDGVVGHTDLENDSGDEATTPISPFSHLLQPLENLKEGVLNSITDSLPEGGIAVPNVLREYGAAENAASDAAVAENAASDAAAVARDRVISGSNSRAAAAGSDTAGSDTDGSRHAGRSPPSESSDDADRGYDDDAVRSPDTKRPMLEPIGLTTCDLIDRFSSLSPYPPTPTPVHSRNLPHSFSFFPFGLQTPMPTGGASATVDSTASHKLGSVYAESSISQKGLDKSSGLHHYSSEGQMTGGLGSVAPFNTLPISAAISATTEHSSEQQQSYYDQDDYITAAPLSGASGASGAAEESTRSSSSTSADNAHMQQTTSVVAAAIPHLLSPMPTLSLSASRSPPPVCLMLPPSVPEAAALAYHRSHTSASTAATITGSSAGPQATHPYYPPLLGSSPQRSQPHHLHVQSAATAAGLISSPVLNPIVPNFTLPPASNTAHHHHHSAAVAAGPLGYNSFYSSNSISDPFAAAASGYAAAFSQGAAPPTAASLLASSDLAAPLSPQLTYTATPSTLQYSTAPPSPLDPPPDFPYNFSTSAHHRHSSVPFLQPLSQHHHHHYGPYPFLTTPFLDSLHSSPEIHSSSSSMGTSAQQSIPPTTNISHLHLSPYHAPSALLHHTPPFALSPLQSSAAAAIHSTTRNTPSPSDIADFNESTIDTSAPELHHQAAAAAAALDSAAAAAGMPLSSPSPDRLPSSPFHAPYSHHHPLTTTASSSIALSAASSSSGHHSSMLSSMLLPQPYQLVSESPLRPYEPSHHHLSGTLPAAAAAAAATQHYQHLETELPVLYDDNNNFDMSGTDAPATATPDALVMQTSDVPYRESALTDRSGVGVGPSTTSSAMNMPQQQQQQRRDQSPTAADATEPHRLSFANIMRELRRYETAAGGGQPQHPSAALPPQHPSAALPPQHPSAALPPQQPSGFGNEQMPSAASSGAGYHHYPNDDNINNNNHQHLSHNNTRLSEFQDLGYRFEISSSSAIDSESSGHAPPDAGNHLLPDGGVCHPLHTDSHRLDHLTGNDSLQLRDSQIHSASRSLAPYWGDGGSGGSDIYASPQRVILSYEEPQVSADLTSGTGFLGSQHQHHTAALQQQQQGIDHTCCPPQQHDTLATPNKVSLQHHHTQLSHRRINGSLAAGIEAVSGSKGIIPLVSNSDRSHHTEASSLVADPSPDREQHQFAPLATSAHLETVTAAPPASAAVPRGAAAKLSIILPGTVKVPWRPSHPTYPSTSPNTATALTPTADANTAGYIHSTAPALGTTTLSTPTANSSAAMSSVSPSTTATTPDTSNQHTQIRSSLGAALHPVSCKPCAFVWTKGCINGQDCQFCHEWHLPKKKKPMKDQKNLMIIARPDGKIEFLRCTIEEALRVCY